MIKTILFDLDGTLINTKQLITETVRKVFDELFGGTQMTDTEITSKFFGPPLKVSFLEYVNQKEITNVIEVYKKHNLVIHDKYTKAFPGAKDTLKFLKNRGIKIGIVSSKMHDVVEKGLVLCELDEYVDLIVGLDDCDEHKPSPKPVLAALEKLESVGEETIYVGDHPNDIEAGARAGVLTCAVTYGEFLKEQLALNPNFIIDELKNLKDIF